MKYVYVLRSDSTSRLYVGVTSDLKNRLSLHNKGSVKSTKSGAPWKVIYYEAHSANGDALRREKYLKTTQGKRALKLMIREALSS